MDGLVVTNVGEVLAHGGADHDLAQLHAESLREQGGVVVRTVGGAKTRHGDGDNTSTIKAQKVEGAHGHEQRERRVKSAGDADNRTRGMRVRKALGKAVGLDGKDVLTALGTAGWIGRHKGVRVNPTRKVHVMDVQREATHVIVHLRGVGDGLERGHAAALGNELTDIQLRERTAVAEGGTLGEEAAVLGHKIMSGEDEVLGGLARTGAGVDVAAYEAGALAAHQLAAVVGLADKSVGGAEIADQGGAGLSVANRRRLRDPEVLADLCGNHELRQLLAGEELAHAEGDVQLARHIDGHDVGGAGNEVAPLVKLVVGGNVALGHHAKNRAGRDDGAAVVELGVHAHGRTHQKQRVKVRRAGGKISQTALGGIEKGILPEEVLAGVARDRELGKHHDRGAVLGAGALRLDRARIHVEGNVRHAHLRRHRRNLDKPVPHLRLLMIRRDSPFVSFCPRNHASPNAGQTLNLRNG